MKKIQYSIILLLLISQNTRSQNQDQDFEFLKFNFDRNTEAKNYTFIGDHFSYEDGLEGQSLSIQPNKGFSNLELDHMVLDGKQSFSIQFWIKTTSKNPTVFLSQKEFLNKGITAQQNSGWAIYASEGTFAWSIGSGKRRLNYERDNGKKLPINDGVWHQITMTYSKELSEVRLYYDGYNKAIYKVSFDFFNDNPLIIGSKKNEFDYENDILQDIKTGAEKLQKLVDTFNTLEISNVNEDEFLSLIVDPKELYLQKLNLINLGTKKIPHENLPILDSLENINKKLYSNPYTVHQNKELTKLKPVSKIYALKDGRVTINNFYAKQFTLKEQLYPSDFSMDNLIIKNSVLNAEDIYKGYIKYQKAKPVPLQQKIDTLTVAVWNIWHGGKHFTINNNDWDSRSRIVEMIRKNNVDIVLMQETYSSGDYIAAELGYYFATTSDWDYCHQGSNISVLSRFPIKDLDVLEDTEFMNVSAKIALSETQEIYAMSNWYGMSSFETVYNFHENRFKQSDTIPILFGGDFNAIPHTDGGNSPASLKMEANGFKDAYRSLHPDVKLFPGYTHQWQERIDQLYYKGENLKNIATEVIHSWFGGFPSDHYMILSNFKLMD